MNENQQQSVEVSNKCQICLKSCQELKALHCQHSFCLCCLQNWMKEKGELECPNCRISHPVPEGGLQELPSNATEVETPENTDGGHGNIECCCGKCNADFFCKDCCQYLCTSCKTTHELFPALKNHTLINAKPLSIEALHQLMCPQHEKELEYYCKICKIPICQKCAIAEHSEDDGEHEPLRASDAFDDLKVKGNALMVQGDIHKQHAQAEIRKYIKSTSELDKTSNNILKDISNTVDEIVKCVQEAGKTLEQKLKDVCLTKKEKTNSQIDELKSTISDVEEKQDSIAKLLKGGEAISLQTCEQEIIELQEKIDGLLPQREPTGGGKIYFSSTKDSILSFVSKYGIGSVSEKPILEITSKNPIKVTSCQTFCIEIAQNSNCEVDIGRYLTLTRPKQPEDEQIKPAKQNRFTSGFSFQSSCNLPCNITYLTPRIVKSKEKYFVEGSSDEDLTIDVKFCNSSIKGSPIQIIIEKLKLVRNVDLWIMDYRRISDLVMSENGWFVVVGNTHEIFIFERSGACISTITLSETSKVNKVCKLKNNNLIFCDQGNRNLTIVKQDGKMVKSIPTGLTKDSLLTGIDVNEDLNLVYVVDQTQNCVQVYNMESNLKLKTIGGSMGGLGGQMNRPSDVATTKEGNLIVADTHNHRVQLFGSDGQFMKVLIGGGDKDGMVIMPSRVGVDYDDNIIVVSEGKVQLFDNCGKFSRVIHQYDKNYFAFSVISQYPRRLAFAELNSKQVVSVDE